ncbi:GNAT family N-acetyltransferase [Gordonia sp. SL306]|uniref:GNAT family N-acetyltransferase n=1 Tax=Gordonia sp. SL306 TaxID=2995145 RepID=UPI002271BF15|nr:GNAT family N-acetyltransferase [Gordonia sp. SL306]WAC55584.1 GNAT family N-acetyltransferase [Gordonia sp. SL306]
MLIERANYDDPALQAFLRAHIDDIAPTAPSDSQHALTIHEMRESPGFRLWVAYLDDELVGTVGLGPVTEGHEELKSMRTAPHRRGSGIGRALLDHALADARGRGVHRVSLETGSMAHFAPARTLYVRAGFVACGAFGAYPADDPNSTFMTMVVD